MEKQKVRVLFIGNSHTYYNDMPAMFLELAGEEHYDCEITMLAHGGWHLAQHLQERACRFNILHGHYDYVVLQEHVYPFGPEEEMEEAFWELDELIHDARSQMVIFMPWTGKEQSQEQEQLIRFHRRIARETGALLVPVGEEWWKFRKENPSIELYASDGEHASEYGSWFAAKHIWNVIQQDLERNNRFMNPELEDYLEDLAFIESLDYLT
ncbi:MAG: hypothetical protein Q4B03_08975 [Lachnospiraceae bacterium]|nr:hypothetical protein [Lachnospiraceae bacterium]